MRLIQGRVVCQRPRGSPGHGGAILHSGIDLSDCTIAWVSHKPVQAVACGVRLQEVYWRYECFQKGAWFSLSFVIVAQEFPNAALDRLGIPVIAVGMSRSKLAETIQNKTSPSLPP